MIDCTVECYSVQVVADIWQYVQYLHVLMNMYIVHHLTVTDINSKQIILLYSELVAGSKYGNSIKN